MEKQQLLVMVKDGRVTLALELGALTVNVPEIAFNIPRIVGSEVHVNQRADKVPFRRFLHPAIFMVAGLVTAYGLWRLLH